MGIIDDDRQWSAVCKRGHVLSDYRGYNRVFQAPAVLDILFRPTRAT